MTSVSAPGGTSLGYTYDGALPTSVSWSGPVAGSVAVAYNNNFQVTQQTVNGASGIAFAYDADGLLRTAGALTLTRNAQNGLLTGTALGSATSTQTYSALGELATLQYRHGTTSQLQTSYTRDDLGRITQLTETVLGVTSTLGYSYDDVGRLIGVTRDGVPVEAYDYDGNGNRLSFMGPGGVVTGTYDDQDRLLTYGSASYSYTANGELVSKTTAAGTTSYDYDVLGNLRTVTLPDATTIEYVIDAQNRRIGRKVNGALVQGFLYAGQLTPAAELDGAGNVISRFVYATRVNVPDYMVRGGVTYRLVTDHLGSVRLVVNVANGAVAQRIDYDGFGRVTQNSAPGFQPFGFAGGLYEHQTGLVRFGARDYDAETGRWTSKDPIGFDGGDANLFGYVQSDPVNVFDVTGMEAFDRCWVADFLTRYVDRMRKSPASFLGGYYVEEFDTKMQDIEYDGNYDDYYEVLGWGSLRSDEFGNFAAGYAATYVYGEYGWFATRLGGIAYANRRRRGNDRNREEDWLDRTSTPMIDLGAQLGQKDRGSKSPQLQSNCGC